jgi:ABC-type phosphate transport system substrate-binding protein
VKIDRLGGAVLAVLSVALPGKAAAPERPFKIIVNPTNRVASISRADLNDIYLGKKTEWDGGLLIQPVDQLESSPLRAAFVQTVHGKSVGDVRNYWEKELAVGTKRPPIHKAETDMLTYVKAHAGAVGYVAGETDVGKLKVVPVGS